HAAGAGYSYDDASDVQESVSSIVPLSDPKDGPVHGEAPLIWDYGDQNASHHSYNESIGCDSTSTLSDTALDPGTETVVQADDFGDANDPDVIVQQDPGSWLSESTQHIVVLPGGTSDPDLCKPTDTDVTLPTRFYVSDLFNVDRGAGLQYYNPPN